MNDEEPANGTPTASPDASGAALPTGDPPAGDVNAGTGEKAPKVVTDPQGRKYVTYPKPAGFSEREHCDAPLGDGSTCRNKRDDCRDHCGAWSRSSGRACQKSPTNGLKRCRHHGGGSLVGPDAPNFRTGKRSMLRPKRLGKLFDAAMEDEDLIASKERVAFWRAHAADLIKNWDDAVGGDFLTKLRAEWLAMEAARDRKDGEALAALMTTIGNMIKAGASAMERTDEIERALDNEAKHSRDEIKRLVVLNQMMDMRQVLTVIHQILDLVTTNVKDRAARQAIYTGYLRIVNLPDGGTEPADEAEDVA